MDDLAFIHGIMVDNNNHGPATMHVNTGSQLQGSPSVGSWITYGLGMPNRNLPGYVVIQDPRGAPVNGAAVWGNGYLPASYQGTLFRSTGAPILDLNLPKGLSREQQRKEFQFVRWLNEQHASERPGESELEARINAYELAFRMRPPRRCTASTTRSPSLSAASACWRVAWWRTESATCCLSMAWKSASTVGTTTAM